MSRRVCSDRGERGLNELESLVDKALVQVDGNGDRPRMLETFASMPRRNSMLRPRHNRSRYGMPAGMRPSPARFAMASRAPTSSVRFNAVSPKRAISRPPLMGC
jgi:hypothetical protein